MVVLASVTACGPGDGARPEPPTEGPSKAAADTGVVEVGVEDFSFLAPSELPSGWTKLRMANEGEEPHFLALARLPEGRTFEEYTEQVIAPFVAGYAEYRSGDQGRAEFLEQLGGQLPEWFGEIEFTSGVGLTAPGQIAQSWVWLEPGSYVMECYVVSPQEGEFHNNLGMLRPLIVSEERSAAQPPEPNVRISLSNYQILVEGEHTRGRNVVAIRVAEDAEGLVAHDLHLARLDEGTSLDEVVSWMDWVDALTSPAPAQFLGGVEGSMAGSTSYVEVDLEPGRYAWISEGYGGEGMVHELTVE